MRESWHASRCHIRPIERSWKPVDRRVPKMAKSIISRTEIVYFQLFLRTAPKSVRCHISDIKLSSTGHLNRICLSH